MTVNGVEGGGSWSDAMLARCASTVMYIYLDCRHRCWRNATVTENYVSLGPNVVPCINGCGRGSFSH